MDQIGLLTVSRLSCLQQLIWKYLQVQSKASYRMTTEAITELYAYNREYLMVSAFGWVLGPECVVL